MIGEATPITDSDVLALARVFALAASARAALSEWEAESVAEIAGRFLLMGRATALTSLDRQLLGDVLAVIEGVAA